MMKTILKTFIVCLSAIVTLPLLSMAQEVEIQTAKVTPDTSIIEAVEPVEKVQVEEFTDLEKDLDTMDKPNTQKDTTSIRIGKTNITIYDDGEKVIINKEDNVDEEKEFDEDWSWDEGDDHDEDFDDNDNDWTFHKKDKDRFKPHWGGVSLGINNFVTETYSTSLPEDQELLLLNTNKSMEFNLNIAQVGLNVYRNHIGFVTGVGFKWNNYKFRNVNTTLVSDSLPLYYYERPEGTNEKSKLTTCYLTVPVLLEFQIPTYDSPIYVSAGIEGGLKLGAWSKEKSINDQKYKDHSDFYTPVWDYRATARVGYGGFGLFATMGLQPVFEKNKGPEVYPFTVGVSLSY